MLSAEDELKIFQNIVAQSPEGLNDPNLIGKFAKAKFQYHAMTSQSEIDRLNPPTSPVQDAQATNSSQPMNSATQDQSGPDMSNMVQSGQDTGQPQMGAYDNL